MATNSSFPSRVKHVLPGSPVSAGNTAAATRALESRTNYLKAVMDAVEAGANQVFRDAPVSPDVLNGQPVYWNAANLRFEPALAGVTEDPDTSSLLPTAASDVLGVVWEKKTTTTADLVLSGLVELDMSNAIDGTITPGRYYLSASAAGKLVRQQPAVTVAVCYVLGPLNDCDTQTAVFVQPTMRNFLQDHIHFSYSLTALPAGTVTPPSAGEKHVITDADEFTPGWLPADHASFDGNAPSGAKFGYNMAQHVALNRNWPPVPIGAVLLEMLKPDDAVHVAGRVPVEQVVFDVNGIWWMTDCYGEAPWPTGTDNASSSSLSASSVSASSASSESETCPLVLGMELILSFLKMTFATERTVVTSLAGDTGQPISFVNCDGDLASTGDLRAKIALALLVDDGEATGSLVLKQITDENHFTQGHVLEGLLAGSDRVTLTSAQTRPVDPDDDDSETLYQGVVTVDFVADPTEREIVPSLARVDDAIERLYNNVPYLGLPKSRTSSVRFQLNIPPTGLPTSPQLRIRALIFGLGNGTMTDLDASYIRLARPVEGTPTPLTEGDTVLSLDTDVEVTTGDAIEVTSEAFDVVAGDTVLFTLTRASDGTPVYDFEIGLVYVRGVIVAGA